MLLPQIYLAYYDYCRFVNHVYELFFLRLTKNNLNFTYVSSLIYPKNKCGQSGIKIVYNFNNAD